ncbi:MAG: hypothetical protein J5746_02315 [Victivallales bacterium]|nr:hypothetical protein [Victivallales bacterium]
MTPYEIPELFPQPKSISKLEDMSELSADVRLITTNVLPLQRKSIRAILSEAGVRVIANKKTYIIEARIEENGDFNFAGVPEACRSDYYEITIQGSEITIRAQQQRGAVMAACTLASLYRLFLAGQKLPNLFIRDWPDLPVRGLIIDTIWGTDRMNLNDWMKAIDQITTLKFNALGLGIYNCLPNSTFEDQNNPAEFFAFNMKDREELRNEHFLNWYSAEKDVWNSETYVSSTIEREDLLSEVINYAREKDLMVFPVFSLFGNNTLFPRMMPEVSALDDKGEPTEKGVCTYSRDNRVFVTEMLAAFLEKYYPDGAPFVHVRLDDVHDLCACPKCRVAGHDEIASDYLLWLTKTLVNRGVGKVIFWQDALVRNSRALESTFARKLFAAGLRDKAVIHWREESGNGFSKKNRPAQAKKAGFASWVCPVISNSYSALYRPSYNNLKNVLEAGIEDKVSGAVAYDIYDTAHYDQLALLSKYSWNVKPLVSIEEGLKHWALAQFGENGGQYEEIIKRLSALASSPELALCAYDTYAVTNGGPYPQAALEKLETMDNAQVRLEDNLAEAQNLIEMINQLASLENINDLSANCLKSLLAELAKICALAETFAWMLSLRKELEGGMVMKRMNTSALKARDALAARMKMVEHNKPNYMTPAVMHPLSKLLAFIEQLTEDLKARAARKQAKLLCWYLK